MFAFQQQEHLIVGSIICALYALFRKHSQSVDLERLVIVLVAVLGLLIPAFRLDYGFVPFFYLLSELSIFYAAQRFSDHSLRHIQLCLQFVFWIGVFGIALGVTSYWDSPEPMGEIFPGSSTNGLPSYLIVLQVALSLSIFLEKNRLPIMSPLATFIVALFGLGRGSIIVAFLILVFSVITNFLVGRKGVELYTRVILGFIVLSSCLAIVEFFYLKGALGELIANSKFGAGVLDVYRGYMVEDYLGKLDFWSFLFGTDYSGTSIDSSYGGNPHNSYIRLHSFYGIWGVLLVLFSPMFILIANKNTAHKLVTFCLLLLVLMRAISEPILFPALLDFFYFGCFFMFFRHSPDISSCPKKSQEGLGAGRAECSDRDSAGSVAKKQVPHSAADSSLR